MWEIDNSLKQIIWVLCQESRQKRRLDMNVYVGGLQNTLDDSGLWK